MRVTLNFDRVFAQQADPWGIGDADAPRYELYRARLLQRCASRSAILDVGSGFGAFLARFRDDFDRHDAIELTEQGVAGGRRRYPWINFFQGSADALELTAAHERRYSAVIFSDVIAYLSSTGRRLALDWIADHLSSDGIALIAAFSPGGRYLTPDELRHLIRTRFAIEEEHLLDTGHYAVVARRRRCLAAITVDYETWQPVPPGRTIDWERDVFAPADALLDAADDAGAPVTFFAEIGEYLSLRQHEPLIAERMARQWRAAVARGHDVQLHLHPNWLPELGARRSEAGEWAWDWTVRRADDFPGDLTSLIGKCKAALEDAVRPTAPEYSVTCFRAGAYEAQPFRRLARALLANGVDSDSSVYAGGHHPDRTYDYSLAYSRHQPYPASHHDPQLRAPPSEAGLLELPIFTPRRNVRWTFDGDNSRTFADVLIHWLKAELRYTSSAESHRRWSLARSLFSAAYAHLHSRARGLNRVLPRRLAHLMTSYGPEPLAQDDFFVLVGHTKADLQADAIRHGIAKLREAGVELVTLSEMRELARNALADASSADPPEEAARQVQREYTAVMADERDERQAARLQDMVPHDRHRILDLGCGAGRWTHRIAEMRPWAEVVGVDAGADFIARAQSRNRTRRNVRFAVADFLRLPAEDGWYDCIYADNSLEHAFDVDGTLQEAHRVLSDGGVLVAAIPSDARNPAHVCDAHSWKTAPDDVRSRLALVGFVDIEVSEVDAYKSLGAAPFPPSMDRMMYVSAWKRSAPVTQRRRAEELARFVYERLDPERPHHSEELVALLAGASAWCAGYAIAAGLLLRREGLDVRWVTMLADGPPASGDAEVDSHEVLEVVPSGESAVVLDPMAGVWHDHSLIALLKTPTLADNNHARDERYLTRHYERYATSYWYGRVAKVAIRTDFRNRHVFRSIDQIRRGDQLQRLRTPREPFRRVLRRSLGNLARDRSG